jgi:Domain of unknown function (DUF4382)
MAQEALKPKKRTRNLALAIVLIIVVVAAVGGYLLYAPATVNLSVKDAPPEPYDPSISAIYVTFVSVELHVANAGNSSGWHTIVQNSTVNLIQVLNVSKVIGSAHVPQGKYTELRFNASQAIVTINGVNVTYNIPSGSFKVPITGGGFQIVGGQTVNVQLDLAFRNSEILNNPTKTLTPVATAKVV